MTPVLRPDEHAQARRQLDDLVGLAQVKKVLSGIESAALYAAKVGDPAPAAPRFRFSGPTGTGKTAVARILAQLLYGLGVLESKTLVEVSGAALKAPFVGQTAALVSSQFERARGGVLFIDEARGLIASDSFTADVLNTLIVEMTRPVNAGTVVILAGYAADLDALLDSDPGLARRLATEVVFEALTAEECVELVRRELDGDSPYTAEPEFFTAFAENARVAVTQPFFGSAGWVLSEVERATLALKVRVMNDLDHYDAAGRRHLIAADLTDTTEEG